MIKEMKKMEKNKSEKRAPYKPTKTSKRKMEEGKMPDNHLTSAAAFVEGGIQDACDDACSICLEPFSGSEPSTVTNCKHDFHLQCVLEWCQRSSKCPMCWQSISLKDPGSQELLEAVENERNIRMNPPRNTTIFHHPTLGDFELQHLPVSATEGELEERIIQHLAAAAAMGRARHIARREGQRGSRASGQGHRPHFLVFSSHPNNPNSSIASVSGSTNPGGGGGGDGSGPTGMANASVSPLLAVGGNHSQMMSSTPTRADQLPVPTGVTNQYGSPNNRRLFHTQSTPSSQDRAGPSDLLAISESVKSRISAMSMRYKDSITKSTRGWKERLFSRTHPPPQDDVRREGNNNTSGVATLSQMMERMEARDSSDGNEIASVSSSREDDRLFQSETNREPHTETEGDGRHLTEANTRGAPFAAN